MICEFNNPPNREQLGLPEREDCPNPPVPVPLIEDHNGGQHFFCAEHGIIIIMEFARLDQMFGRA